MGHDTTPDLHEYFADDSAVLCAAVVSLTREYARGADDWKVRSMVGLGDPPLEWSDLQFGMLDAARGLRNELAAFGQDASLPEDVVDVLGPVFDPRERCRMFCTEAIGQGGDQGLDGAKACCAPCRAAFRALRPFFELVSAPGLPEDVRDQLHVVMDAMAEGQMHRDKVWAVIRALSPEE